MCKNKVLVFLLGVIYLLFVYFQFSGNLYFANCVGSLILPVLTLGYFCNVKNKSVYFIVFLILYSISDMLVFVENIISPYLYYFLGNSLYILAFVAMIIEISKQLSFKYIIKNYKLYMIVLISLNIYMAYVLLDIANPYLELNSEYFIEITYNITMLLILSIALLNFFYKDSRKSFFLLVAALCLVFSDVLNMAYMYVSEQELLNLLAITLALVGFFFLYLQSRLKDKSRNAIA